VTLEPPVADPRSVRCFVFRLISTAMGTPEHALEVED
jgi:hypothetical protein